MTANVRVIVSVNDGDENDGDDANKNRIQRGPSEADVPDIKVIYVKSSARGQMECAFFE